MTPFESRLFVRGIELKRDAVASFDTYPYSLPAIRELRALTFRAPVTFLVGENGSGKSTLLEAIAVNAGYNAEGGSRNLRFETRATHSGLHDKLRLIRGVERPRDGYFLRAESFYNVASEIDRLDEPEAALSPSRQLALLVRMNDLVASGSQFIVATHSPILLGARDAEIFVLDDGGIVATPYEETDHYTVTRRFLEDRDAMLRRLLD